MSGPDLPDGAPGNELFRVDVWVTVGFVVFAALAVAAPAALEIPFAVACSVAFGAGVVAFAWAFAISVERSRTEQVGLAGIYAMTPSCPAGVRRRFHTVTAVQVVVAIATASMRPYTPQAFGILVPMFGFAIAGLWAARHGDFPPRPGRSGPGNRQTTRSTNE